MSVDVKVHRSLGLALLTAGLIALAAEARADWNTFQGNAAHTGHVSGTYGFTNVKLLWQTTAYAGALNGIAVGNSTVVVTNQARFSNNPSVHGLDQSSGVILWSHAFGTNNDTTSPPAYAPNMKMFYVQSDGNTYGGGNYLNAFDPATGITIFSAPTALNGRHTSTRPPTTALSTRAAGITVACIRSTGSPALRTGSAKCRSTMAGRQPSMEPMPMLTPAVAT